MFSRILKGAPLGNQNAAGPHHASGGMPLDASGKAVLTHYSKQPNLTTIDPAKHGSGYAGAERQRKEMYPDTWVDRTYHGIGVGQPEGYVRESGLGNHEYTSTHDPATLYDFKTDPENLYKSVSTIHENAMSNYEKSIKDKGYAGYFIKHEKSGYIAATFHPIPATKALKLEFGEALKFNPNHDAQGRFSDSDSSAFFSITNQAAVDKAKDKYINSHEFFVKEVAHDYAKTLGFPVERVLIETKDQVFNLNGRVFNYAGSFDPRDGNCRLFPSQMGTDRAIKEVLTHEIAHAEYQAVKDALSAERKALGDHPPVSFERNGQPYVGPPVRMDGDLREGLGLEKKFPVYAAFNKVDSPSTAVMAQLEKEDGCTPYSKDWWVAYHAGFATFRQAADETYAEMNMLVLRSQLRMDSKPTAKLLDDRLKQQGIAPVWRKYYSAVKKAYKAVQKTSKKSDTEDFKL